jgi:hypothetical protein
MLYDDTYSGPRYRYGLVYRPLVFAQVPAGWIIFSNRQDPNFRHGTVDYPFEISSEIVEAYQLVFVGKY